MSIAVMEDELFSWLLAAAGSQAILEYSAVVFVCCQSAAHSCSCDEKLFVANRALKELKAPATTVVSLLHRPSFALCQQSRQERVGCTMATAVLLLTHEGEHGRHRGQRQRARVQPPMNIDP